MSSLRNSLHRRNHKERSQLAHRARLGILEKHKDYVLRARDYHSKQDRINHLRQKAADRNKDEFYFGMTREKTEGGVHIKDRGNAALPSDIVKVLKSQDENYIRTMRTAGMKKIEKLKSQLSALADLIKPVRLGGEDNDEDALDEGELEVLREAGIIAKPHAGRRRKSGGQSKGKHIIFAENEEQARQYSVASTGKSSENEDVEMIASEGSDVNLGWKTPDEKVKRTNQKGKGKVTEDEGMSSDLAEEEVEMGATRNRAQLLKELSARLTRDRQLRYAERELEMQRLLMVKGASRKLKGVEKVGDEDEDEEDEDGETRRPKKVDEKTWKPRVYKWRLERKR